jgi:hypothetical protein
MAFKIDNNGDIVVNPNTGLSVQVEGVASLEQDAMSECRCEQQSWFADATYGRNPLVWKLPTGMNDKVADIKRIITKYYQPESISDDLNGRIIIK